MSQSGNYEQALDYIDRKVSTAAAANPGSSSPQFKSTNWNNAQGVNARREARSLALAFAVVGKLVADGHITVDLSDKEWDVKFHLAVDSVAYVLYDSE